MKAVDKRALSSFFVCSKADDTASKEALLTNPGVVTSSTVRLVSGV